MLQIKEEKYDGMKGVRARPAVCIGWLSLSPFIMHLNDFPHVMLFLFLVKHE